MKANMRRHFRAPFVAREAAQGAWRLSSKFLAVDVWVCGADAQAAVAFSQGAIFALDIEWHGLHARLGTTTHHGTFHLQARSVIVHEPLSRLYDALPLASFDARTRRFWRTVFILARIPGGRSLLKILARRRPRR